MSLTDAAVRQARPKEKEYKLRDERGLLLVVRPTGAKWWRLRYAFQGKEKMISLGVYPDVSLSMARERRDEARRLIAEGKDPSAERQAEKKTLKLASEATFEKIARHYLATLAHRVRRGKGSIKTYKKAKWMLETFIFPALGSKPIVQITAPELLVELKKIELKGLHEACRRTKQRCGKVFRHAIGLGHQVRDLTPDLRGLLEAPDVEHHAALTDPRQIGELLLDIDGYSGRFITRCALRFEPLVFLRSRELRNLEWEHVDFEAAELRIPRGIMKGKRVYHIVPLAIQALAILKELHPVTGARRYVFPKLGDPSKTMSENTINDALRTLGYTGDEMTGHGFRTVASTLLNEDGTWRADAIERQLSHQEDDEVRGAYNAAEYLAERRRMMQAYADKLDVLRSKARVRRLKAVA
jgi:integrase